MGDYVEIVDAGETFDYTPAPNTTFKLRIVPDDVEKRLRKAATSHEWDKGQRVQSFDGHKFAGEILAYAIISWSGVRKVRIVDGERKHEDLERTKENILLLPESLKSDITRLCLGKEAAAALAETEKKD
jgi:hypothetical protein